MHARKIKLAYRTDLDMMKYRKQKTTILRSKVKQLGKIQKLGSNDSETSPEDSICLVCPDKWNQ